ncbi:DUF2909 family protein [Psychrobium sp. 1_MG-2023]|uniref:DUF2909 family protein n=1 Tax=Psychrobium sp. 1_MG-2023 TaxID=3062624 RepID=UPI000C345C90|nr:DUF2909 family protein [Psychrobium sp. 1_MG-2023]MDP2561831.1 DUF2909 family protein [Psychrobium sp. 1_MG-2023]PKF55797.1 DUF2909 domain-containing protein [Alteromonadales bacterium alter-6D02]
MSVIKIIIIGLFIFVFFSLFQALRMMRTPEKSVLMSRFIARRLLFSVIIFIVILLSVAFGLITPNPRPY